VDRLVIQHRAAWRARVRYPGSVFPDNLASPLSSDALVMVLLGGVEQFGAGHRPRLQGALDLAGEPDDLSKLAGRVIVLIVVAFPRHLGIWRDPASAAPFVEVCASRITDRDAE